MAALSGAAIGGTTGGIVGGLIGLGIPEIEAKRYDEKLRSGHFLIAVHTHDDDQEDRAKESSSTLAPKTSHLRRCRPLPKRSKSPGPNA